MAQSLSRVVVHIVFGTKNRTPYLDDQELRARVHAYLARVLKNLGCEPILVNGTEDHVHILCNLSRTVTLAKVVEQTKTSSSKWLKDQRDQCRDFRWQAGYGAFSVSQSGVESTRAYVAAQQEHHRRVSYQDELRALCRKHEIELDEEYAWD
ncbi:MAG: IS200/IS605 family transposase [Deltaproteobacteria bacterium]|nr:IS200/IS605 family transposase [Deltaproteobacteria bacterium]